MIDVSLKSYSTLRRTGLFAATVSTVAIWFLYLLLGFDAVDGAMYDALLSLKTKVFCRKPKVVLVSTQKREYPTTDEAVDIARKLHTLGASKVVFIGVPNDGPSESSRNLAELQKKGEVVLASPASFKPRLDAYEFAARETMLSKLLSRPSVAAIPAIPGGVYRHQRRTYLTDKQITPSMEYEIATVCGVPRKIGEAFLIHYGGASGSLPIVKIDDVVNDATIPDLFRNRVAIVAMSCDLVVPSLTTPGSGAAKLSRLEFHGHAANTLLNQNCIRLVRPSVCFGILSLVSAMTLALCQSIRLVAAARIVLLFSALAVALSFGILCWHNIWLPVVPILLVQFCSLAAVYDQRVEFLSSGVQQLALDIDSRVKNNPAPDTKSKDSPWMEIVMYLRQSLDIHRMVIFDLADKTHRLQEVELYNCAFEDIKERRRDWRRTPFSWATREKRCISLTSRRSEFLHNADIDEEQFLAPLIIGSRIIGFIVLGVEKEYIDSFPDFTNLLQDYSNQIVDRLYQHHRARARAAHGSGWRSLSEVPEQNAYDKLTDSATRLERRLLRLDELFEKSELASAVFDVSGKLLTANARMSLLVEQQGYAISQLRLIELISKLTDANDEESRRRIRTVLRSKQPTSAMVHLSNHDSPFMLRLRPLTNDRDGSENDRLARLQEWSTFEVHGILCELIDQSPFKKVSECNDHVANSLEQSVCQQLAAVELATSMLVGPDADQESREDYQQMIHDQVAEAASSIRAAQATLKESASATVGLLAIEPWHPLERAVDRIQQTTQGIAIKWSRDEMRSHVLAEFDVLVEAFEASLKTIAAGVVRPATIEITSEESVDRITFSMIERVGDAQVSPEKSQSSKSAPGRLVTGRTGCERCVQRISECGGTLLELTDEPNWKLKFSLPRFC